MSDIENGAAVGDEQGDPWAVPTHQLLDDRSIPAIGLGTYPMRGEECVEAVMSALSLGYRLVDTAVNYENEDAVGQAVRRSGVAREDVFLTSKLPGRHHAYDDAVASVEASLERLGTDYLDLHLIHWPNPSVGRYREAWQALVDCRDRGLIRSVGVSNFTAEHLDAIIEDSGVVPVVNQIELHPLFPQGPQRADHEERGIRTEAWSPLGKRDAPFEEEAVAQAAMRLGVTPAQVILRWHVQLGTVPVPKSGDPVRQRQNLDVFDIELTEHEMAGICRLGRDDGRLFGGDPDTHEEM
ncbi:aldo/keto reductase [Nocardioidaceae bacterium]|nr:aldo/keto reductase [Nocardioidaceae bacterium]